MLSLGWQGFEYIYGGADMQKNDAYKMMNLIESSGKDTKKNCFPA